MPDKKEPKLFEPLLRDLPQAKRIWLAQVLNMPGFKVWTELMDAGAFEANELVIKTDPEADNYSKVLEARQQGARSVSVYAARVLKSAKWHAEQVNHVEAQEQKDAVDVVKKVYEQKNFGIHVNKVSQS